MKEDYDILNKYYRNELYNELEDYIKQRRKTFKIDKKEKYIKNIQIFDDFNIDKGRVAMEIINLLKKYVETDTKKLGFN